MAKIIELSPGTGEILHTELTINFATPPMTIENLPGEAIPGFTGFSSFEGTDQSPDISFQALGYTFNPRFSDGSIETDNLNGFSAGNTLGISLHADNFIAFDGRYTFTDDHRSKTVDFNQGQNGADKSPEPYGGDSPKGFEVHARGSENSDHGNNISMTHKNGAPPYEGIAEEVTVAPSGDHNSDGHPDNGSNGLGHDNKDKSDHNNDGRADNGDNGKGHSDPEPEVLNLPDTVFTEGVDVVNFNDFNAAQLNPTPSWYDQYTTTDAMHYALDGDDIVYLPNDQATADLIGYDTSIGFNGGYGSDIIYGGDMDDYIMTGRWVSDAEWNYSSNSQGLTTDIDIVFGGGGDDYIMGHKYVDELHGGDGNDTILANGSYWGFTGGDSIYGDAGDDNLRGSYGKDSIFGGTGNDNIDGQWGDDYLDGGTGTDYIRGDKGNDTFVYRVGDGGVDGNLDSFLGGEGDDTLLFKFDTEDQLIDSLNMVAAADEATTGDTGSWFTSTLGMFRMVQIENVEVEIAGEQVDYHDYAPVPEPDLVAVDPIAYGFG